MHAWNDTNSVSVQSTEGADRSDLRRAGNMADERNAPPLPTERAVSSIVPGPEVDCTAFPQIATKVSAALTKALPTKVCHHHEALWLLLTTAAMITGGYFGWQQWAWYWAVGFGLLCGVPFSVAAVVIEAWLIRQHVARLMRRLKKMRKQLGCGVMIVMEQVLNHVTYLEALGLPDITTEDCAETAEVRFLRLLRGRLADWIASESHDAAMMAACRDAWITFVGGPDCPAWLKTRQRPTVPSHKVENFVSSDVSAVYAAPVQASPTAVSRSYRSQTAPASKSSFLLLRFIIATVAGLGVAVAIYVSGWPPNAHRPDAPLNDLWITMAVFGGLTFLFILAWKFFLNALLFHIIGGTLSDD